MKRIRTKKTICKSICRIPPITATKGEDIRPVLKCQLFIVLELDALKTSYLTDIKTSF